MSDLRKYLIGLLGLGLILTLLIGGGTSTVAASTAVFINEIHYDNTGTDSGEAIEVAGPAATDLTGWTIVLYNGSGGASYDTDSLSGTIPDQQSGFGTVVLNYPSNGIQNGAPDGVALVDASSTVIQFLCYEGTFTAVGGPADGLTCVDIGVSESGTGAVGNSLQLSGSGTTYEDFTWQAEAANTFGAINTGQTFGGGPTPTPTITPTPSPTPTPAPPSDVLINEVDSDSSLTDVLEFVELYDGGVGNTDLSGLVVVFYNGSADTSYAAFDLDGFSTDANGYFLLGNALVVPTPGIIFADNFLQNGADAVALYAGNATDFPDGTAVTTANLYDALVYDTDDADDAGLLVLLNAAQPQVNENGAGDKDFDSNQRCPNGSGGQRNTDTYGQGDSTPAASNVCVAPPVVATIMEIQGAAHKSTLDGQLVADVPGIVTAVDTNGFYMQDATGDADIATSDGIFVFTSSAPTVLVGDSVLVDGAVSEFYPGGYSTGNLATTEIVNPTITVISSGNTLPAATVIGTGGRIPPTTIIDDDATGDVETTGTFDPATDGIDFYESLEGMRLQVNDGIVVGPTNNFGEFAIVGDNGVNAGLDTPRGGVIIQPTDFNPERIILDDGLQVSPNASVGDSVNTPLIGVLDYSFGNFKFLAVDPVTATPGGLISETTTAPTVDQLSVATFNVENLDPLDLQSRIDALANEIVNHLLSPDIVAVQEVQDNTGPTDDGVVDASQTYNALITAITAAGGPTYSFRDIAPINNTDGGEPGGNIRVGFLFRTDRGLTFVDRPGGDATTATTVSLGPNGVELSFSPGRIDPTNLWFNDSRKPLAGEFEFKGHKVIVVVNHFNSKGGDNDLFGRIQPPVLTTEITRTNQAQIVNDFVDSILALDTNANVIVLGDLNDFHFSTPLATLSGGVLTDLITTLPAEERYTYIFDGNSQDLDHILISNNLLNTAAPQFDIVHANAEFQAQPTDHDPSVVRLTLPLCSTNCLRSAGILFQARRIGAQVGVRGNVAIRNENNQPVAGATVNVTWTYPDGSTQNAAGTTNSAGIVRFQILDGLGTYTLTITNITKAGATFDPDHSVLSGSITLPPLEARWATRPTWR